MCGIAGLTIKNRNIVGDLQEQVREIMFKLLKDNVSRGRDAAGYSLINDENVIVSKGNRSSTFLMPSRYCEGDNKNEKMFLNELFNNNFHTAIMHCRASTKGNSQENKNNHPIIRGNIIGVHNGTIDDDIINTYRTITGMEPVAGSEVDSALIFEMLNRVDNISDIIFVLNRFIHYAVAFIDIKNDSLFVARDISDKRKIYYFNNRDVFIFAQEETILRNAIKDSEYIRRCYKVTCEKDVFDKIKPFELPNNNIFCVEGQKTKMIKTRDYDGNILNHLSGLLLKYEKTNDVLKKLDADGLIDPAESSICDVLRIKKNVVQEHPKNLIIESNNDSSEMGNGIAPNPICMEMF